MPIRIEVEEPAHRGFLETVQFRIAVSQKMMKEGRSRSSRAHHEIVIGVAEIFHAGPIVGQNQIGDRENF